MEVPVCELLPDKVVVSVAVIDWLRVSLWELVCVWLADWVSEGVPVLDEDDDALGLCDWLGVNVSLAVAVTLAV